MPEGWVAVEEPQGWSAVEEESNQDKLRRILRERAGLPERQYSTVRTGAEQSLSDVVETFNPVSNLRGIGQAAYGTLAGLIPRSASEAVNPVSQFKKFITDPMLATQGQANVALQRGRVPEAAFKDVAAKVPIIGPTAAGIYDTALGGEPGQAMGQGQFLVGTLAAPDIPAVRKFASAAERLTQPIAKPTPRELAARAEYAPNVAALRERVAAARPKPSTEPVVYARQALTERIAQNVQETHATAKASLDARWDALREKVGNDVPADAGRLAKVEADARSSHLSNSTPDSIAKYDAVMGKVREEGFSPEAALEQEVAEGLGYKTAEQARHRVPAQAFDGMVERLKSEGLAEQPMNTFGDLRARYTRIGEELAKGNLPGDVYHALKQTLQGYDAIIQELANTKGAGADYAALKADWSQYMQDFREPGSPVARALNAKDLPVVTRNASGNTYARFAEILGRNRRHGGNPALVQELAGLKAREAAIKATRPSTKPGPTKQSVAAKPSRLKLLLGGAVGAAGGAIVGHTVLGYHAGKEAARSIYKK